MGESNEKTTGVGQCESRKEEGKGRQLSTAARKAAHKSKNGGFP